MPIDINFGQLQSPDQSNALLAGFDAGRAKGLQARADSAYAAYQANPGDPGAANALLAADPVRGTAIVRAQREQQQQQAEAERRAQFGQAAAGVLPPELAQLAQIDPEGAVKIWEFKTKAGEAQVKAAAEAQGVLAAAATSLQGVPYEQRRAALAQMAPQLAQQGVTPEMIAGFDPTDHAIGAVVAQALGVKGVLEWQDKQHDNARADAQFGEAHRHNQTMEGIASYNATKSGPGGGGAAPSGYRYKADGSLEPIPGGPAGGGKALTEGQAKGVGLYRAASAAANAMNEVKGYNPSLVANALDKTDLTATNLGQAERRVLNAQRAFANAILRLETGATINASETADKVRVLFPLPGDGPEVLADKARLRAETLAALRAAAGPGAKELPLVTAPKQAPAKAGWSIKPKGQ